jgi:hypothetical protein
MNASGVKFRSRCGAARENLMTDPGVSVQRRRHPTWRPHQGGSGHLDRPRGTRSAATAGTRARALTTSARNSRTEGSSTTPRLFIGNLRSG